MPLGVNMTLNEAKDYLNENGYELLDDTFLGADYKKYKKAVYKLLQKYEVDLVNNVKIIEDWIRDYFLDKMTAYDCAKSIKDNI
jgi:hypothetical protein